MDYNESSENTTASPLIKRQRRNAIKPNSIEAQLLMQAGVMHNMSHNLTLVESIPEQYNERTLTLDLALPSAPAPQSSMAAPLVLDHHAHPPLNTSIKSSNPPPVENAGGVVSSSSAAPAMTAAAATVETATMGAAVEEGVLLASEKKDLDEGAL